MKFNKYYLQGIRALQIMFFIMWCWFGLRGPEYQFFGFGASAILNNNVVVPFFNIINGVLFLVPIYLLHLPKRKFNLISKEEYF